MPRIGQVGVLTTVSGGLLLVLTLLAALLQVSIPVVSDTQSGLLGLLLLGIGFGIARFTPGYGAGNPRR